MSLSEKTETADATGEGDARAATGQQADQTSRKREGGSLIERWDALERKNAPPPRSTAKKPVATPTTAQARTSTRPQPDAATPVESASGDELLLQDVAKEHDVPASEKPGESANRPTKRAKSGITKVNYRMSYGAPASKPSASEKGTETAKTQAPATRGSNAASMRGATQEPAARSAPNAEGQKQPELSQAMQQPHPSGSHAATDQTQSTSSSVSTSRAVDRGEQTAAAKAASVSADGHTASAQGAANDVLGGNAKESAAHDVTADGTQMLSAKSNTGDVATTDESGKQLASADPVTSAHPARLAKDDDDMSYAHYGRIVGFGILLLVLGVGGFVAWAALAPISSGVVAIGSVKLEGERKTVQHLEGGIIKELLVTEGDTVKEGQVLVRLDGSKAEAVLDVQSSEHDALLAKKSRLLSERNNLNEVVFEQPLLEKAGNPGIAELLESERSLFADRKANIDDQLNIYDSWVEGYNREITGLQAQKSAVATQLFHINDELKSVETLYKKGVMPKTRLLELKRTAAGLNGQIGSLTADIARTEQKIGEAQLRGVALQTQRTEDISDELAQVEISIRRVLEQLPAQQDVVDRLEIKAPRSGRVVNLRFHTAGGVISPSTPILEIVPEDEKLVIEAHVKITDIDILEPGMPAQVTLTAYSQRKTPPVAGKLLQVSADRVDNPNTGEAFYKAFVEIDSTALAALKNVKLYPGMPASVQFVSGERTPMDYLLAPIEAGLRNSWLEE